MPTTYNDQGYPVDAFNLAVPQALTVQSITLIDQNDDGLIDTNDTINGLAVTAVYRGDTITVDGVEIVGATLYLAGGGRIFTATDGSILEDGTATDSSWVFSSTNVDVTTLGPICFARGTRLRAANGEVPVEELRVGDLVMTLDHGLQPIRWIGRKSAGGRGQFAPVEIAAGALGNTHPLTVSQQHRMMLQGTAAHALFDEDEMLCAAKHLVNGDTIKIAPCDEIEYFHILLDGHQILCAEGCWAESFHPGDQAMNSDSEVREELLALFPELANLDGIKIWALSRPELKAHEARLLTAGMALAP